MSNDLTLVIHTSSAMGGLALSEGDSLNDEITWQTRVPSKDNPLRISHSEMATTELTRFLDKNNKGVHDIKKIICTHGPGSFTGIRVGLSLAKGLAYSNQCPIYLLNNCLALAISHGQPNQPFVCLIDAQKNKLFFANYSVRSNGFCNEIHEPQLIGLSELESLLPEELALYAGGGLERYEDFINPDTLERLTALEGHKVKPLLLAHYTNRYIDDFSPCTWEQAQPLYLRKSAAEEVRVEKLNS